MCVCNDDLPLCINNWKSPDVIDHVSAFFIPYNTVSITDRQALVIWVPEFQIVRKSHIKHLSYINLFSLNWICSTLICMMYLQLNRWIKIYLEFWLVTYYCLVWKWKLWSHDEKINKNKIVFLNAFFWSWVTYT